VTVIVSTFERAGYLPELLQALSRQTFAQENFEVIVVDDASTDATWGCLTELAAATSLRCLGLRLDRNCGQGTARNVGAAQARGQVLAFTDDDCVPSPAWLETLTTPLLRSTGPGLASDGQAVVVQGRTVAWPEDEGGGAWSRVVWVLRPTWLFETCNIAYRRADFVGVGGFPPRGEALSTGSGKAVGEDALLGWRVIERGASLAFAPDALVYHRHLPGSYRDWLRDQRGKAVFPALARSHQLCRRVLWARWFLAPRTAAFDLAVVGGALTLATHRPGWLLAGAPWIWMALPEAGQRVGRHPAVRLGQLAIGDVVGLGSLIVGSVRWRRLVL
jgi:glycosyltransferase involved in cell wall biosynthesis